MSFQGPLLNWIGVRRDAKETRSRRSIGCKVFYEQADVRILKTMADKYEDVFISPVHQLFEQATASRPVIDIFINREDQRTLRIGCSSDAPVKL